MNSINTRGTSRARLSLRFGGVHAQALAHQPLAATNMPINELRRLVAAMVD